MPQRSRAGSPRSSTGGPISPSAAPWSKTTWRDTARRHDFCLYERYTNRNVLTGEIKMPDSIEGRHPLNAKLVEDAHGKASTRQASGTASPGTFASSCCSTPTSKASLSPSATSKGPKTSSTCRSATTSITTGRSRKSRTTGKAFSNGSQSYWEDAAPSSHRPWIVGSLAG